MIIDLRAIHEIVKSLNIRPNKDLGQNFLVDSNIPQAIVNYLDIKHNEKVLEIGPGLGSLTHFIIEKKCDLDIVDIDTRMTEFLSEVYKENNINIINKDIRKCDVSYYDKIIGNLPYYITTELIAFLLIYAKKTKKMVLMIQNEASARFLGNEKNSYGAITVLCALLGGVKKVLTVKPNCFYPMPKCNSVVLEFSFNEGVDRDTAIETYKMCKILFLNRRKTILNNLNNYTKHSDVSKKILQLLNIKENERPEDITPKQFLDMFNLAKDLKK